MAASWGKSWGKSWGVSWGYALTPPTPEPYLPGGPGGSNKAGKRLRRGHPVSAIQSDIYAYLYDLLPDSTDQQEYFTNYLESVIVSQDLELASLEELLQTITANLDKLVAVEAQTDAERNHRKLQVAAYKQQVIENHKKLRRRRDEEAIIHLLLHAI